MSALIPLRRFTSAVINITMGSLRQIRGLSLLCRKPIKSKFQSNPSVSHRFASVEPKVLSINVPVKGGSALVGYADVGPRDGSIVLAIHGAPGGISDFAELYEPLSAAGIRMIVPEFPGYGNTTLGNSTLFDESTEARTELILNFLHALDVTRVAVVAGHSLGSVAAFNLAANTDIFQSIVYLNGVGLRPHKGVSPYWLMKMVSSLLDNRWTEKLALRLLWDGYKKTGSEDLLLYFGHVVGFIIETEQGLKASFRGVLRLGFEQLHANALRVREKNLPLICAFTQNDKLIEWELQLEFAKHCGVVDKNIVRWDAFRHHIKGPSLDDATYPMALVFKRGGHLVHRSQADIIITSILQLVRRTQL